MTFQMHFSFKVLSCFLMCFVVYITLQFHCMEKSSSEILPATQHRVNMFFSAELYKSKVRLLNSNLSMLGVVLYGPLELACVCIVGLVTVRFALDSQFEAVKWSVCPAQTERLFDEFFHS